MAKQFHIQAHPSQLNLPPVTTEMLLELFPFGKDDCSVVSPPSNLHIFYSLHQSPNIHTTSHTKLTPHTRNASQQRDVDCRGGK